MKIEEIKQAISDLYDKSNKCSNLLNAPHNNYKHIAMSISESVNRWFKRFDGEIGCILDYQRL